MSKDNFISFLFFTPATGRKTGRAFAKLSDRQESAAFHPQESLGMRFIAANGWSEGRTLKAENINNSLELCWRTVWQKSSMSAFVTSRTTWQRDQEVSESYTLPVWRGTDTQENITRCCRATWSFQFKQFCYTEGFHLKQIQHTEMLKTSV